MNEIIDLSTDINVITAEIKSYQQIAGQSIFEIGKRLKHVKENDLAQGQWTNWCEKQCLIKRQTANRFIQAFEQFPNGTTSYQIESAKVFELLSLPQEINRQHFIEEPHNIPSTGEVKTVNEMSVRELREVKKALKEKDKLLHEAQTEVTQARKSEQLTRKQLEALEQQEPRIIEREVVKEVQVESKEHINIINELKDKNAELKDTAEFYKQKVEDLSKDIGDMDKEERVDHFRANKTVYNLIAYMDKLLKDAAVTSLMRGAIATSNDATKELLDTRIGAFQEFINDLKIAKTGRKIN